MHPRFGRSSLRIFIVSVLGLALIAGVTFSAFMARQSHANPKAANVLQKVGGGVSSAVVRTGTVNLATLATAPKTTAKPAPRTNKTDRPIKTPAQLIAYQKATLAHPGSLPQAVSATPPSGANIYNGGNLPVLQNKVAGLTSVDGGGWYPPDQAIAASPTNVFEGVNNVMEVYNTSLGAAFGPWTPDSFFASVKQTNDTFSDPQISYDAQQRFWLISWLEITPSGNDYIDIAISKNTSASPITNYNVYQTDPRIAGSDVFCDYDTMGYDYWGMYVTCTSFSLSTQAFLGNNTYAYSLANMLSGSLGTWDFFNSIQTDLGAPGAYRLSPASEEGVPQAEWITASDAGLLTSTSNDLTTCAMTNTQAIHTGTLPTLTCSNSTLPLSYTDPIGAAQPGTTATVYSGVGFKQIAYRDGRLYFALPMTLTCSGKVHDGIMWADVTPQLTTLTANNPQHSNGIYANYTEQAYYCFSTGDLYMPTLEASIENDLTLVFNYSSPSVHPGIVFTGRANTDAPGTMGQTGASRNVVSGTASNNSGRWGDYSACALNPNGGTVYCGGEFGGPNTVLNGTGWDTELYTIRME